MSGQVCGKFVTEEHTCTQRLKEDGSPHDGICAFIEIEEQPAPTPSLVPPADGIFSFQGNDAVMIENQILRKHFLILELNGSQYRLILDNEEIIVDPESMGSGQAPSPGPR